MTFKPYRFPTYFEATKGNTAQTASFLDFLAGFDPIRKTAEVTA